MKKTRVLVTGGLGFIGSHTVVELIARGCEVIIVDNLINAELGVLERIATITGVRPVFHQLDVCDAPSLAKVCVGAGIEVVIHFAALKAVGESVQKPLTYFQNNLGSLMSVLQCMQEAGISGLIFSSSATVYGEPRVLPVTEAFPFQKALSAYGSTKQIGEEILEKVTAAGAIRNISLRYFNPVGAHASGLIGESPRGIPNNLFPYVMQAAAGKLKQLTVHGGDYDTPDGTCIRDYIHVVDIARAHVCACERLVGNQQLSAFEVFNLGTGRGSSVLEIVKTFEVVTGQKLNYSIGPRRPGDVPVVYADTQKANAILGWRAELGLKEMISSAWQWQRNVG